MAASRAPALPLSVAARQVAADYLVLTKPKVQSLLLLTTISAMEIAGDPSPGLIAATCLGGYLSAGGAGAINHFYDRDIDARMARTASRPVPSGRVSPRAALVFGCVLGALSVLWLSATVNVTAAALFCAGGFGGLYLAGSLVLGGAFIALAVRLARRADRRSALVLYLFSLAYLALLFVTMVADARL